MIISHLNAQSLPNKLHRAAGRRFALNVCTYRNDLVSFKRGQPQSGDVGDDVAAETGTGAATDAGNERRR